MEEYRLDLKIRNNIILRKLKQNGYETNGEFCRKNNVMKYVSRLNDIIAMKVSPLNSQGEFHECVRFLAEKLNCNEIDLFTETQMNTILSTNRRAIEVNEAELKFMLENKKEQSLLEDMLQNEKRNEKIFEMIDTLHPREKQVIEMRFGLREKEKTLEECAIELDCSRERIRQIEARALRKLRHPYRANIIKDYVEN